MTDGPFLWYANRGTGVVILVLLTLTTVLGVLSRRGDAHGRVPRFLTQSLHRRVALISSALLLAHVATAVVDEYVDIRWWQAVVPFVATYRPLYLGLGTDACWGASVLHGLGIGTDAATSWGRTTGLACVAAVTLALLVRLAGLALAARPATGGAR